MAVKKGKGQNRQQQIAAQERLCNLFEPCETPEAPLCPIQSATLRTGIWYPDEPICNARQFQNLSWIKKQRQIAALKLKSSPGFFTVRMLNTIHVVTDYLRGADPDQTDAESKWLKERSGRKQKTTRKKKTGKTAGSRVKSTIQKPQMLF